MKQVPVEAVSEAEYETRVKEDEELEQCCAGEGGLREFLMGCLWSVDIQLMFVERACMYQVDVPGGAARGDAGAVLVRGAGRGAVVRGGGGEGLFW